MVSISIVIAAHDQGSELQRNLPLLLAQDFKPGFEVIVVDESSTDETEEVLKQLRAEHPNLYTTFIPASSHYVSRRKLAITLGIKAAKGKWVILTEADCHPENPAWLQTMYQEMTDANDVVLGFTSYSPDTKSSRRFVRLIHWRRQQLRPYCYDGANIAIRKQAFMERNGFLKNLSHLRGEFDFLVNETDPDRIALCNSPEARVCQEAPTNRLWDAHQLFYMDTRRHLPHLCSATVVHHLADRHSSELLAHPGGIGCGSHTAEQSDSCHCRRLADCHAGLAHVQDLEHHQVLWRAVCPVAASTARPGHSLALRDLLAALPLR